MPTTRRKFWETKFEQNIERDKQSKKALRRLGWKVVIVWECDVRKDPTKAVKRIIEGLAGKTRVGKLVYQLPSKGEILKVAENRARLAYKAKK